ncbi:MAG: aminopeptidase N, partial [Gammaproteobacteria bacterium]
MREAQAPTIYLKDYQPPAFLIDSVDLDFDLRDDYTQVTGRLAMRRNPAYPAGKEALVLDGQEMDLQSVSLNGQELPVDCWQVDADQLTVHEVPECFTLEVVTRINPAANTALEGLYFSDGM